ncbi:MAG TPA: gamma-glutamyltransferase [Rhizomicrobium sp.]|jgi:gamma-glutamyltranspeptidase/glutathione hydrolase
MSRRLIALLTVPAFLLGGCQTVTSLGDHTAATFGLEDEPKSYTASMVSEPKRTGIAVADEPLAARAGAAALADDGSAVDAVATMFFTLTATYPVAAGLGSGGICLVRDAGGQVTEFDFLTKAPKAGGYYALPGAVAGFATMHRIYGALPWQRIVAPGEAFASTGFPISEALAARLPAAQNTLRLDAGLAAEFLDETGKPRIAGADTRNVPLGVTLSQIRLYKADGFYKGTVAANIAAYSASAGGGISAAELAAAAAVQGAARARAMGSFTAYVPGTGTGAGAFNAAMLDNLSRTIRANPANAAATAVGQTLGSFGVASVPGDMGSTGFAAVDASGAAAACAVTLNGPFGSGRTAGNTGVVLATTPSSQQGLASAFLAPVIATSNGQVALAGAGAGGPNGTAAAMIAVLEAVGGRPLGKRGDLRGTGRAPYDTVNMISCSSDACVALTDPGAHGAGVTAEMTMR